MLSHLLAPPLTSAVCSGHCSNVFAVNSTQVPKTGASYTYTITLANGAKAVPSGSYLKVAVATVTASTPSCTISSTALSGTNHDQLSADLAATSGTVACTFDVNVTSYVSAGAVPAFDVTASWVTASGGTTLVDTAFFIPKITTAAQPVYTGNALGVPTAAVPADSTKYVTGELQRCKVSSSFFRHVHGKQCADIAGVHTLLL